MKSSLNKKSTQYNWDLIRKSRHLASLCKMSFSVFPSFVLIFSTVGNL